MICKFSTINGSLWQKSLYFQLGQMKQMFRGFFQQFIFKKKRICPWTIKHNITLSLKTYFPTSTKLFWRVKGRFVVFLFSSFYLLLCNKTKCGIFSTDSFLTLHYNYLCVFYVRINYSFKSYLAKVHGYYAFGVIQFTGETLI